DECAPAAAGDAGEDATYSGRPSVARSLRPDAPGRPSREPDSTDPWSPVPVRPGTQEGRDSRMRKTIAFCRNAFRGKKVHRAAQRRPPIAPLTPSVVADVDPAVNDMSGAVPYPLDPDASPQTGVAPWVGSAQKRSRAQQGICRQRPDCGLCPHGRSAA